MYVCGIFNIVVFFLNVVFIHVSKMFYCYSTLHVRKIKFQGQSSFVSNWTWNCPPQTYHHCYLVCSPPPVVPSDAVSHPEITSSSVFEIGDAITYTCTNPAFAIANNVAICQPDGTWIPSSFGCNQIGNYTAVHERVLVYVLRLVVYAVYTWAILKLEI